MNNGILLPRYQKVHLSPVSPPAPTLNMANTPSIPLHALRHPLLFVTHPVHPLHQPQTWIKKALQGQTTLFSMDINGVESLVILQNHNFLAQMISERIKKAVKYFVSHMWLTNVMDLLQTSLSPQLIHTMQMLWNLPHLLNQFPNMNEVAQTPFFTPQAVINVEP